MRLNNYIVNTCQRPYHVQNTGSRLITAVKQRWAWLVLGWVTTWEHHVLLVFFYLDTGFSWFPCVYKRMLRWFPRLQVATACFSCSPSDLSLLDPYFIFMYMHNNHCHRVTALSQLHMLLLLFNEVLK